MGTVPRLSVLMPVRNAERHLSEAIESVLAQSFGDFELLAIDDNSTDRTGSMLRDYAARDGRVRVLSHPGRGLISALNWGVQIARADLIARMDGDDICRPDRFALQMEAMNRHPRCAVLGGQSALIDGRGMELEATSHFPLEHEGIREQLRYDSAIVHPTVLARRVILQEFPFRPSMLHAEDMDAWIRISERHPVMNLPDVVLSYRRHPTQVSSTHSRRQDFTHDLALLSAECRAQGYDPIDDLTEPPPLDLAAARSAGLHPEILDLVALHARGMRYLEARGQQEDRSGRQSEPVHGSMAAS